MINREYYVGGQARREASEWFVASRGMERERGKRDEKKNEKKTEGMFYRSTDYIA